MTRADAEILTVDDLAELFRCDKETAAARLTSGDLPGVKVGRSWIIPRQALFERLNEKAREEATSRRANQTSTLDRAKRRVTTLSAEQKSSSPLTGTVLIPTTVSNLRGRKRREPPVLPSLEKISSI